MLNSSSPAPLLIHCQCLFSSGSPFKPGTLAEPEQVPSNTLYGGTSNRRMVGLVILTLTTGTGERGCVCVHMSERERGVCVCVCVRKRARRERGEGETGREGRERRRERQRVCNFYQPHCS